MATTPFDWSVGYPTYRAPVFARNIVATSHPVAAQAGLQMMARGGNAIDAIVAAASCMTIVEPISNGLGSDAFAIVWDGKQLQGLNASGTAPTGMDVGYFARKHGGVFPVRGWDTVTVPGAVSAWAGLHERYGKLPFADCLASAISLAERGYGVTPIVQRKWAAQIPQLRDQPGFAEHFMPRGRAPEVGERFVLKDAGATLRRIAATRGRDFYAGETAEKLVAHAAANGALMSLADLRDYAPEWVAPLGKQYRDYTVHELPPNGQGIAALIALGILAKLDLGEEPVDSALTQHLQIESMKLAFADTYRYVADPRYMQVSPASLLDDAYLTERARLIRRDRATDFQHGLPPSGGTIYLTAADENGMMVSYIQSNYMGFGSGVVVPGTGVSLQNRAYCFSLDPNHPNVVAPGKRPFQTIIPGFLTRNGQAQMSFGVMGGNMQPQGHLQTLSRLIDFHQQPQAACDAPRWRVMKGMDMDFEPTMNAALRESLQKMGHRYTPQDDSYMDFGSGQFIWRVSQSAEDGYIAASDSRRDGSAVGF